MIRRANLDDADGIGDVFLAASAGMTYLPEIYTDAQKRRWLRDGVLGQQEVWVAEELGSIVGFAALSDDTLEHLYTHPQGRGAGTVLLDKAKERRPAGFRFWVFQKNEGARRFYERRGCRLVELTNGSGNEEHEPDALYEWRP